MDRRETAALLAFIGRLDPRTIRTDTAEARDQIAQWHELLADVPLATEHGWDARTAVRDHVLASPYPILPVDIARTWRAHWRDRLDRHTDPTPTADPDDPAAWRAELAHARHAVATGSAAPAGHRQLTTGRRGPETEERLQATGSTIPPGARAMLARYRPRQAARQAAIDHGKPDPLGVRCDWCQAPRGQHCRSRRIGPEGAAHGTAPRAPHPSRLDHAAERATRQPAAA